MTWIEKTHHRRRRQDALGIRPENLELAEAGLRLGVDVVEELRADAYVCGRADVSGTEQTIVARVDWRDPPAEGAVIYLAPGVSSGIHVFATDSGVRLC